MIDDDGDDLLAKFRQWKQRSDWLTWEVTIVLLAIAVALGIAVVLHMRGR